jgi:hypothetical protein
VRLLIAKSLFMRYIISREFIMTTVLTKETPLDIGIDGECPICAQNRDPETGTPRYNAKALAAIEEGRAMLRGEIPANWHKPEELEQVWKELLED